MQQNLQKKRGLVKRVFDNVYNKYDLMNDFMSLGVHRQWKRELIRQMNPYPESNLIDVACGTGDIAKLFAENTSNKSKILCVDFNKKMLDEGKKRLSNTKIRFFDFLCIFFMTAFLNICSKFFGTLSLRFRLLT